MKKFIVVLLILLTTFAARAQGGYTCTTCFFHPGWYVGGNLGTNLFMAEGNFFLGSGPYAFSLGQNAGLYEGFQFGYNFDSYMGLRVMQSNLIHRWPDIREQSSNGSYRQYTFFSDNLTADFMFNLTNMAYGFDGLRKFNFYLLAGIGATFRAKQDFQAYFIGGILRGGAQLNYKLREDLDLTLMADGNLVDDNFNNFASGFPYDLYGTLSVGIIYHFESKKFAGF